MSVTRWFRSPTKRRDAAVMAPPVSTVKMLGFVRRESHSKLPEAEVGFGVAAKRHFVSGAGAERHCVSLKENLQPFGAQRFIGIDYN